MVVRVIGSVLLVAHLLLVAWGGLLPRDVAWVTAPNTVPLAGLRADLALGPAEAARLIAEGLLLLAPLGVLLPMCEGRLDVSGWGSLIRTTAAGALVSLALELLQTAVPGQVVDVDSVLLNTLGVALAHVLVVPVARRRMRRRLASREGRPQGRVVTGNERAQGRTPRIPRVPIAR